MSADLGLDVYGLVVPSAGQVASTGSLPGEENSPGAVGVLDGEDSLIGSH